MIRRTIEHIEKIGRFPENISLNSNFSLLTREIAEFFRDKRFRLNTSIDGLPEANDLVRIYKSGGKTFHDIIMGINLVKEIGYQVNGVGITFCDENFDMVNVDIIDWMNSQGVPNVLFDIDFVNMVNLDPEEVADKITAMEVRCAEGIWKTPLLL